MVSKTLDKRWTAAGCALALFAGVVTSVIAQQQPAFFTAADADRDGFITRDEFRTATAKWLPAGTSSASKEQLEATLDSMFPESLLTGMLAGRGPQNQTPKPADVEKMMAALPSKAPAKPAHPRKVLVL